MSSSEEELFVIVLVLEEEERKRRKRKHRRYWIHNICSKRNVYGEFHSLFGNLVQDDAKFFQYFRMTHEKIMELFDILEQDITEQNTTFRESIVPTERLAVCLR
jgi:hypothetical protein